ncbi:MAG: hypothetical protein L6R40_008044 [Gallowayella cf. fulva]|nr:MAG: hypothetical protein L6R40_008044 [Xanthomendoza cf. fulva]
MSLELDTRTRSTFTLQPGKEPIDYHHEKESRGPVYALINNHVSPTPPPARQSPPPRLPMILLIIALAIMTALAILAAALGGSISVKRQNEIHSLRDQLNSTRTAFEKFQTDSANQPTHSNTSSSLPTSQPAKLSDIQPTTNCTDIGDNKKYISSYTQMPFTVHCETDYPGSDMLGIWAFTFADCIEACASWNGHQNSPRCYSVSYDYSNVDAFTEENGMGNCFLKDNGNVEPRFRNVTSSADAQLSASSNKRRRAWN